MLAKTWHVLQLNINKDMARVKADHEAEQENMSKGIARVTAEH